MGSRYQDLLAEMEVGIDADGEGGQRDVSLCQAVADLLEEGKDPQSAIEEAEAEKETADEPGDPYLKILSVETKDGWCFPDDGHSENEICQYTLEWQLEYSAPGPAHGIKCIRQGVDFYESENFYGKMFETQSGVWEHSMTTGGFYSELGNYDEHFYCEMYVPYLDGGELVTRVDADIVAPLTTVRED